MSPDTTKHMSTVKVKKKMYQIQLYLLTNIYFFKHNNQAKNEPRHYAQMFNGKVYNLWLTNKEANMKQEAEEYIVLYVNIKKLRPDYWNRNKFFRPMNILKILWAISWPVAGKDQG